ncbi:type II toxin-antitoxin system RelE/ParE family toxin [Mesorhizobium sp. M0768]|uniref:type II toxin-antitoxin system RelE/ParE family toxin n=1 Tax=Mesorhizobium sp. M0768 TaxID=2956996 RepID=UPI003336F03F
MLDGSFPRGYDATDGDVDAALDAKAAQLAKEGLLRVPRLRTLPSAQADLVNLLEHITERAAAPISRDGLWEHCAKKFRDLATFGRLRPELRPDVRSFSLRDYVIFFRYRTS